MGHAQTSCELKNIFAALVKQSKPPESPVDAPNIKHMEPTVNIPNPLYTEPTADISNLSQLKPAENILSLSQPQPTVNILKLPQTEPLVQAPNLSQESIGSAKLASEGDELGKELQCTADSSKVSALPPHDQSSPSIMKDNSGTKTQKYASLLTLSVPRHALDSISLAPRRSGVFGTEALEGAKEDGKEMARLMSGEAKASSSIELQNLAMVSEEVKRSSAELQSKIDETETRLTMVSWEGKSLPVELRGKARKLESKVAMLQLKPGEPELVVKMGERRANASVANSTPKFRIKIKNRTLNK
ncbi:TBP-associated factor 2 [Actinidia rufa]|uniref:TBP-associated factor 2 n=1 Tax=Actinidia rufa TaxID=165716 RepID=A0A7J0G533_9ERIC|nr:TBP-associated factor 2 [Actinidia rufa]